MSDIDFVLTAKGDGAVELLKALGVGLNELAIATTNVASLDTPSNNDNDNVQDQSSTLVIDSTPEPVVAQPEPDQTQESESNSAPEVSTDADVSEEVNHENASADEPEQAGDPAPVNNEPNAFNP